MAGNGVTVVVRVRPLNDAERSRGDSADGVRCISEGNVLANNRQLTFDAAFDGSEQEQVFERTGMRALLDASLQGYAATVLAYGQTGSGKTYTMTGSDPNAESLGAASPASEGIIPRAVRHLFQTLESYTASRSGVSYAVSASYLEIYNEQINDLLNTSSTGLPIRWHAAQGFFVEGLVVVDCETVDELMLVFQEGTKNRKVGSHLLNKDSSRSHSIMQVQVTSRAHVASDGYGAAGAAGGAGGPGTDHVIETHGRLSFVDLAGSERLDQSGSIGRGARETAHINSSLLVLGKVIAALSAAGESGRQGHVPFRDSKLTKLLADSLGGSSLTLMIGCVSPSYESIDESNNTLHYLSAAKRIQNRPVAQAIQVSGMAASLLSLRDEVHGLRMQNLALHQQLSSAGAPGAQQAPGAGGARGTPQRPAASAGGGAQHAPLLRAQSTPDKARDEASQRRDASALEQMAEELGLLRRQNAHMQMTNNLLQRSYDEVKRENDALQEKLDRLERIFIDKDQDDAS